MKHELTLEKLNESDIPHILNLSNLVRWDYTIEELQTILRSGLAYGHRNHVGGLASCGAVICYGETLASIGMVIVDQSYRGQGLGKTITQKCIEQVSKNTPIMLIATEDGFPLYKKLGFNAVSSVHKLIKNDNQLNNLFSIDENIVIESYKSDYFNSIVKLDYDANGANRTEFLKHRIKQAMQSLVVKRQEEIIGFGLSIETPANLILGPIIAPNKDIAFQLIYELSKPYSGSLRIDIPAENSSFTKMLINEGFNLVRKPPVMILNKGVLPERNETLFGISAQVFG